MAEDKQPPKNLAFLEMRESLNQLHDNLPYILEYWKLDSESMYVRYQELKNAGFTEKEALEIVKARGSVV